MKSQSTPRSPRPREQHRPLLRPPKNAPGSVRAPWPPGSCLFVVILGRPLEVVLEGAGELVEQSHLLAVLQEPRRSRGLICSGRNTERG